MKECLKAYSVSIVSYKNGKTTMSLNLQWTALSCFKTLKPGFHISQFIGNHRRCIVGGHWRRKFIRKDKAFYSPMSIADELRYMKTRL